MRKCSLILILSWGLMACSTGVENSSVIDAEGSAVQARAFLGTKTITVNSATSTGAVMWGGIGFLYGLSEYPNSIGYKMSDSMLTGLGHPQYTSQKAPWGAQHPDGDALNTAVQAKRTGMRGVGIYVQDYYASWPYPTDSVQSYITNVVDKVAASVVANTNRSFVHYVPFNEPDWIWYAASGTRFTQFLSDWKAVYQELRAKDPGCKIAGPNFSYYNDTAYRAFFTYAKANNCLPDITTWHELDGSLFSGWYTHYNNYRKIETDLGLAKKEIFINEYGRQSGDLHVPGNLLQYLARFENSKVYGGLAYWTTIGTLNDLIANNYTTGNLPGDSLNLPNAAWYLYQWYGQMSGNTVQTVLPDPNGSLQALASKNGSTVKVIFGGAPGASDTFNTSLVVTGLSGSSVPYKIWSTDDSGNAAAPSPSVVKQGTATVTNGSATIQYNNCWAHSAYLLQIN